MCLTSNEEESQEEKWEEKGKILWQNNSLILTYPSVWNSCPKGSLIIIYKFVLNKIYIICKKFNF